jgi:transcription antitermination factor NusG
VNEEGNWFVVKTKTRAEKKVAQDLLSAGWEAYCPTYFVLKQWSDRKKKVEIPLINGVVFVRFGRKSEADIYKNINVSTILKEGQKISVVYDYEVDNLKILCNQWDEDLITREEAINLNTGDYVEVKRGSFAGLRGDLIKTKGKHKIVVHLEMLHMSFHVEVPKSLVRRLNAPRVNEKVI